MLGTLLDLLGVVVVLLSFGWLGVAGLISPALLGGRSRGGVLVGGVMGCAAGLYLMTAMAQAPEPEPELAVVSAPASVSAPAAASDPPSLPDTPIREWILESHVAAAAGEFGLLRLGVSCEDDDWIVALGVMEELTGSDGFRSCIICPGQCRSRRGSCTGWKRTTIPSLAAAPRQAPGKWLTGRAFGALGVVVAQLRRMPAERA